MNTDKKNVMPQAIVVAAILLSSSIFYLGYVVSKNGSLPNVNPSQVVQNNKVEDTAQNNPQPSEQKPSVQKVKLDDDPVKGNKDAKVTMVEFSDYECPFCKRHFESTNPQIIKEYVDTGKLKVVFRDLPLTFHDPAATKMAVAANCAKEQGGDTAYYKMNEKIFATTPGNGTGISDENLAKLAGEIGVNSSIFSTCLQDKDGKQKAEVQADLAYASTLGATGTPTFFIGKSTSTGEIDGEILVGAQPYAAFKAIIDKYLAE